jgi:serine/threonine-protein kinase
MKSMRLAALLVIVCFGLCGAQAQASQTFSTIAGSGLPGVSDGSGSTATFLFPYGIAVGPDGTIYVSDFQGQRIRAIDKQHRVSTLAGGGELDADGLRVAGDYRDGAAATARFDFPAGIAVDGKGAVYVADSANRCIRVVEHGSVRTLTGSPSRNAIDGTLATAGFDQPRALAFDRDGNLYVGDFGVGIRKITPAGAVTTIALPAEYGNYVTSITVQPDGLLLVDNNSVLFLHPGGTPHQYLFSRPTHDHSSNLAQADVLGGYPFAIAPLSDQKYAFTDPREQAIRLFDNTNFVEALSAPPTDEYAVFGGGYRDGAHAQVQTPLGIAALGPNSVVFADAGNRRIRAIAHIETRHWATHVSDPFGEYRDASKYYRVLILGDCYVGWGVPFDSTVGGRLEAQLNANRKQLGIPRDVRVAMVWPGDAASIRDYVRDVVSTGVADAVVWEFNDAVPNEEFTPDRGTLLNPLIDLSTWKASLTPKVAAIGASLHQANIPYYVLLQPTPLYYPLIEQYGVRQLYVPPVWSSVEPIYERMFHGTTDGVIDAGPAILQKERSAHHRLLYLSDGDYQLSAAGDALLEGLLYTRLAADKPWRTTP